MPFRLRTAALAAAFFGCACVGSVIASDFGNDRVFVCAPLDVHACLNGFQCQQGTAEDEDDDVDAMVFVRVDLRARTMKMRGRTASLITHETHSEGKVVIQGAESGYGWSIAIDETNGHLVAAVAGQEAAFVFFGACRLEAL